MLTTSVMICALVAFMIWNNWPDLIETIGQYLVAHARSVRKRSEIFNELTGEKKWN